MTVEELSITPVIEFRMSSSFLATVRPADQLILDKLKNIPDHWWLLMDCHTDDQRAYWSECRLFYGRLRVFLKDYFSGRGTDWESLPKADREFWRNYRDEWLELYDLLECGWSYIRQGFAKNGRDLPVQFPGEMLILILEELAAEMFLPCTEFASPSRSKFSPQAVYRVYQQYQRSLKNTSIAEVLKVLSRESFQSSPFLICCLSICSKESKKDRLLKRKLNTYLTIQAQSDADHLKIAHPRNHASGHQWVNGKKLPLPSKGS